MKQIGNIGLALLAGLCIASQAQAADRVMCEFTAHTRFGLVPPKVLIEFNDNRGSALAYDAQIHEVYGKPIAAELEETGSSRYTISWRIENLPLRGNSTASSQNIVRLNLKAMTASFTGYLGGFANHARGSGKCQPIS
ncbi:hypothetical protein [Pseudophaeobacter sp.]|jgi:hypothetical protein|uniref:hypothetical protein n=1 Tax=Pseudophaeobacter sp. TaxID=1971739 RepID=UPI0032D8D020